MQSPPSSPRASPNPLPLTPPATHAPQRLPDKHLLLPSPYPAANPPGYHYLHSYPTPSPQPLQPPSSFAHPLDSLSSHGFSHSHTFASQPQPPQGPTPVHFQSRLAPDRQTVSCQLQPSKHLRLLIFSSPIVPRPRHVQGCQLFFCDEQYVYR